MTGKNSLGIYLEIIFARMVLHCITLFFRINYVCRTEEIVPVLCPSGGGGVLRDCLLRRRWMLKFLGTKRKRQLLRSLSSDPLPEGHPVDRDSFFCLALM